MSEPARPEDLRVSDVDRRVQSVLWGARTRGELERVTAGLAAPPPAATLPVRRVFSDDGGGVTIRAASLAVNVVVWGLVAATNDEAIYPWPIWLAPAGVVLLVLYVAGIGRPRRS